MPDRKPEFAGVFQGKEVNCPGADGRLEVPAAVIVGVSSRGVYFLCCPYFSTLDGVPGRCGTAALDRDSHPACILAAREAYEAVR